MSAQATIHVEIPDAIWLTSNGRYHWAVKARATGRTEIKKTEL